MLQVTKLIFVLNSGVPTFLTFSLSLLFSKLSLTNFYFFQLSLPHFSHPFLWVSPPFCLLHLVSSCLKTHQNNSKHTKTLDSRLSSFHKPPINTQAGRSRSRLGVASIWRHLSIHTSVPTPLQHQPALESPPPLFVRALPGAAGLRPPNAVLTPVARRNIQGYMKKKIM